MAEQPTTKRMIFTNDNNPLMNLNAFNNKAPANKLHDDVVGRNG